MKNWKNFEARREPIKNPKYKIHFEGNQTANTVKEIVYEYYLCDRCESEIKILDNNRKIQDGGIVQIPISRYSKLKLALCNKCLRSTLKEINEIYGTNF